MALPLSAPGAIGPPREAAACWRAANVREGAAAATASGIPIEPLAGPADVAALDEEVMTVEVLESTDGLSLSGTRVRFLGEPLHFALGPDVLGRIFNGVGKVIDGGPPIAAERSFRIDGLAINPAQRAQPSDFIETGITAVDLLDSLVRGQKLPIFTGAGLPADALAARVATGARLLGDQQLCLLGDQLPRLARERSIAPDSHPARAHRLLDRGAVAPGLRADLVPERGLQRPLVETREAWIALASAPDLDAAARTATADAVDLLARGRGMDWEDAYMLASLVCDLRISQDVDPYRTCKMVIPKRYLPRLPGLPERRPVRRRGRTTARKQRR